MIFDRIMRNETKPNIPLTISREMNNSVIGISHRTVTSNHAEIIVSVILAASDKYKYVNDDFVK